MTKETLPCASPDRNRRKLLQGIGALPLALAGSQTVAATAADTATVTRVAAMTQSVSGSARGRVHRHQAFASSFAWQGETLGPSRVRFDRALPRGLSGTLWRNGPARMARGTTRYEHWFDGDGMVHAFDLEGRELAHRGRIVRTSRYVAEEKAGRFIRDGFGTHFADAATVSKPDDLNVANISVLPLGDELLALWEAGSAWRLDPQSLKTLGRKVFSPETDGLAFSAHPRIDADGRIWSFGYLSGSGKLALYDIAPDGRLNRAVVIAAEQADMVHDFVITQRHLVFVLPPLNWQGDDTGADRAFMNRLSWNENGATQVLVVDKATLSVTRRFELPAFFAFHFGNAWEDGDSIRIEAARAPAFDQLMSAITSATLGEEPGSPLHAHHALDIVLDMKSGSARMETLPMAGTDFPRFDQRFTGLPTSRLVVMAHRVSAGAPAFGFNQVVVFDRKRASLQRFDYGEAVLAEEHVFVPANGAAEGEGWVIGTAYDWHTQRSQLSVFHARALADGPVAVANLPYALPLGLHGQFAAH